MALATALDSALAAADFAGAERIKGELGQARQELAIAEATTTAPQAAHEAVERQQAEAARAIQEAQQRGEAQRIIGDAIAAEKRALDAIQEALSQMYACIGAAQDAFRQAQAWEDKAGHERRKVADARMMLGEIQAPGPQVSKPNAASALMERVPAIRALMQWRR